MSSRTYEFAEVDGGTRIPERWNGQRQGTLPPALLRVVVTLLVRTPDRPAYNRWMMREAVRALKRFLESTW